MNAQENIWSSSSILWTCKSSVSKCVFPTHNVCIYFDTHHQPSTFVCPTEILAFSDRVEEFHQINTEVVACSVDSKYTHYAWINTPRDEGGLSDLKIPLLSDITKQISKDYGVLLEDAGFTLRFVWSALSVNELYHKYLTFIFRGLFIIDTKGILRQITMNDIPVCVMRRDHFSSMK